MKVRVRLFAMLRERAGAGELELELPDGARVADALERLGPVSSGVRVVMAVNREYAGPEHVLAPDDELALIPPVSGGATPDTASAIVTGPISLDALVERVRDPRAGAVVTFQGVTREVSHLDYEAYEEMAGPRLAAIVDDAVARHGACRGAAEHRVGRVPLSEASVAVAVSAPHRAQAFAAAREVIDRVKEEVPIWKREHGEWKDGTPPAAP